MPLERCDGDGWRWGQQGHCYHGPDAKEKALKQGYAENPEKFKEEVNSGSEKFSDQELQSVFGSISTWLRNFLR